MKKPLADPCKQFHSFLKDTHASLKRDIKKAAKEMVKNPQHWFEWSRNDFAVAAELAVVQHLLNYYTSKPPDLMDVKIYLTREALRRASNVHSSTSPTSNLLNTFIDAIFADYVEKVVRFERGY